MSGGRRPVGFALCSLCSHPIVSHRDWGATSDSCTDCERCSPPTIERAGVVFVFDGAEYRDPVLGGVLIGADQ